MLCIIGTFTVRLTLGL